MGLQAEKLEVVKMIIETDDKKIISEIKALFKNHLKITKKNSGLEGFYENFREGVREVKTSVDNKTALKDAKTWLNELIVLWGI